MFRGKVRSIHFVGIGGIGMSGLAQILNTLGFEVSGSDQRDGEMTAQLRHKGVKVELGHRAENLDRADVVVVSSAIASDNPEVLAARAAQIPVISRAEMLAELMRLKYAITIAGSHGKTTTTSLVATVLRAAGLDPTVVVGGRMAALGSNAELGAGDLLVAEADESDGSFLKLTPTIAAITNIDPEHLDFYGSFEALESAFLAFAQRVPFYGLAVLCLDHPTVQALLPRLERRSVTYGMSPQADYFARDLEHRGLSTSFQVMCRQRSFGRFTLNMPGQHNVLNCLAAIAIADELAVPLDVMKQSLASFHGVARRFTVVGEPAGVTLVDDYGHHPAEIKATLQAARGAYAGRVLVMFQPHRYTRTQALFDEFAGAFNDADQLFVLDIYPAGEAPIGGIDSSALTERIKSYGHHAVQYAPDTAALISSVAAVAQAGDVVISLGAGNVNRLLDPLAARLLAGVGRGGATP